MMEGVEEKRLSFPAWHYFLETHVQRQQIQYEHETFEQLVIGLKLGRTFSYFDAIKKGLRQNPVFYTEMVQRALESRVYKCVTEWHLAQTDKDVRRCLAACYILAHLLNLSGPDTRLVDAQDRKIELQITATAIFDFLEQQYFIQPMSAFEVNDETDFLDLTQDAPLLQGILE